jgi:hypothetical protein
MPQLCSSKILSILSSDILNIYSLLSATDLFHIQIEQMTQLQFCVLYSSVFMLMV